MLEKCFHEQRHCSLLSPILTSITRWRPERCRSETPLEESRIRFDQTRPQTSGARAQAAFVDPGEVFLPRVQVPKSLVLAAAAVSAPARLVTPLLSFFSSTSAFPLLCGLGGILDWKAGNPILPRTGARPAGEGTEGKWRMGGT